jgi:hypothetical protein
LTRKDTISEEIVGYHAKSAELETERDDIETELADLIDFKLTNHTNGTEARVTRKCRLCGVEGHIIARTKTTDGRDTCPTYPDGKPKEE